MAGRSSDVERLCWPTPSPLGLHERRARRPRGELQHSGAPCSIIEGSIAAPTAPPPLALAFCAGPPQRGGVREREPVHEDAVEDAAQRGLPRR